ncbi:MAG: hypothetical protein HQ478_11205 [Chloroflexi bacterium]|nr:hypothetical protein [Chloroflexota bacterium]
MTTQSLLPDPGRSRGLSSSQLIRLVNEIEATEQPVTLRFFGNDRQDDRPEDEVWPPDMVRNGSAGYIWVRAGETELAISGSFPTPVALDDFDSLERLIEFITIPRLVAIVLLRLGAYSVGLAKDGDLLVTKSDTRYVKGQHKKGGQSQRRFERNREKWVRELFDKACRDFKERVGERSREVNHLALGGDRQVLNSFVKRCPEVAKLADRKLPVLLRVDRPNTTALKECVRGLWIWRVHRR